MGFVLGFGFIELQRVAWAYLFSLLLLGCNQKKKEDKQKREHDRQSVINTKKSPSKRKLHAMSIFTISNRRYIKNKKQDDEFNDH